MRYSNKYYLRWTLFAGSLCPITIPFLSFDLSLERVIVPIIAFYLFSLFSFNAKIKKEFFMHKYSGISFLLIFAIFSFTLFFADFQNMTLPIRLLYNFLSGYIIYVLFTLTYNTKINHPEYFIYFAIIISLVLYLYNSFSFERMQLISKLTASNKLGVNPNAVLNSIAFLIIINQLLVIKSSNNLNKIINLIFIMICALQFSRQNLISGMFLAIHSLRQNKFFIMLIASSTAFIFNIVDLRIYTYLAKGTSQITGKLESTRLEWWFSSVDHIFNYPYLPNFEFPVDNTLLTLLLHTGFLFGSIISIIVIFALYKIGRLSIIILLSVFTLFVLNDILYEASFWFLVFSSLDSRIFNYRKIHL